MEAVNSHDTIEDEVKSDLLCLPSLATKESTFEVRSPRLYFMSSGVVAEEEETRIALLREECAKRFQFPGRKARGVVFSPLL